MAIKELFKKNDKTKVEEVDAGVIETSVEHKDKPQESSNTDKVTLELTMQELILLGKALEQSENTQLFYRVQEGIDNNNLLGKILEKLPKTKE